MTELEILKLRRVARVTVAGQPLTVGRSSRNDIVLPHRAVSREHCVIEIVDGVTRLHDRGSSRGTRVNGKRVESALLADGDRIEIGPFELTVRGVGSAPGDERVSPVGGAASGDEDGDTEPLGDVEPPESDATSTDVPALTDDSDATHRIEQLDRREAELDERHLQMEQRALTLASREAECTARQQSIEEGDRADAEERSRLEQSIAAFESLVETTRGERDAERRQVETMRAELDEMRGVVTAGREERDAFREQGDVLQAELDATRKQLDHTEGRLAQLDAFGADLRELTLRLAEVQRSLRALETAWTETDEWLADADADGRGDSEEAIRYQRQHEAIGEQLATMTHEREDLIAQIVTTVAAVEGLQDEDT